MLEKLPFYGQVLVFAGLALGIVVIAYFVFPNMQTMQAEIDTMEEDLAEKQREISDGQAIEAPSLSSSHALVRPTYAPVEPYRGAFPIVQVKLKTLIGCLRETSTLPFAPMGSLRQVTYRSGSLRRAQLKRRLIAPCGEIGP